ncbi:MAG: shikimate dehydrogenase [Saprospiraceae bacterium]|nr:shikimate dehydrogenase [Saprospiraceae bacterium]
MIGTYKMLSFHKNPDLLSHHRLFGLIGYPLSHSFSKKYFTQKFEEEGISDTFYELFPIEDIILFPQLIKSYPNLSGLNVTIPYKEQVIPYLHQLDESANEIGAVNVIKIKNGRLTGHNTDAYGFEVSLRNFLQTNDISNIQALVLGTGGAAKAVMYVLRKMGIMHQSVSREASKANLTYEVLDKALMNEFRLIINTSPVGMLPNIESYPNIPYYCLSNRHLLFDLVYNPPETVFLKKGKNYGAKTCNGMEMLHLQAEHAWSTWNG